MMTIPAAENQHYWLRVANAQKEGSLAAAKAWQRYEGPRGGEGWENPVTGEVRYQKDKPGDSGDSGERRESDGAWASVEDTRGRKYSEFPVDPDDSEWGAWSPYHLILPDGTRETLTSAYPDTIFTRDEDGEIVRHDPDELVQTGALIEEPAQVFSDELKTDERVAAAVRLGRYGADIDWDGNFERGQRKWAKVFDDMSDRELAEALWLSTRNIGYLEPDNQPYLSSDLREWVGAYVEDDGTLEGDYSIGSWRAMGPENLAHITSRMSKGALLSTVDKIAEELEGKGDGPKELRWRVVTAAYVYTSEEGVRESLGEKYPDTLAGVREDVDTLLYADDVDEFKSAFIEGWHGMAGTSAAYLMQQAVRDLEPNKTGKSEAWARNVPVADVYLPEQTKQNARELYEETQSKLPDKPKTLYRGVKSEVTVHGNLESWTELKYIAKKFGDNVMTAEVDPEDVFATWETLGDEWPEEKVKGKKEWMVLGGGLA